MRSESPPADGRAHLDRGTKVEGKLAFDCPVWIDGEVGGEIAAKESVTIGEAAVITASVHAASVVVAGKVSGNISATNRIELRPSARAECDLAAPVIVILEGAEFEGHCSMRPDGVERKVSVLPGADHQAHRSSNDKKETAARAAS
jgi:cytoskeletal protein CcmA (bactofilin family)